MALVIVFDTNYLRGLGLREYSTGELPGKLRAQLERAVGRGDVLILPNTVRLEMNHWLRDQHQKRAESIQKNIQALQTEGYTIIAPEQGARPPPDILATMQAACRSIVHLVPTLEDYQEAERRTSFREEPNPDRDGEEMRDRVIWCQVMRYAARVRGSVLFVSGDSLFRNGVETDEGRRHNVSVAQTAAELDQRLGDRPEHIRLLIERLLRFGDQLRERGVNLTAESILAIENLRKTKAQDGSIAHWFDLRTEGLRLPNPTHAMLHTIDDLPVSLVIDDFTLALPVPADALRDAVVQQAEREQDIYELRHLIGGNP